MLRISLMVVTLMTVASCSYFSDQSSQPVTSENLEKVYKADIRRTAGGIPHIKSDDLGGLGFGTLFAMAEDNVCIMARHYMMLSASRSRYQGPENGNLESDFFYQLLIDRGVGSEAISDELEQLFAGSAAGYNHYLDLTGVEYLPDASCRGQDWVVPVKTIDVKRVSRIEIFLDYMRPMIVAAKPPSVSASDSAKAKQPQAEQRLSDKWIATAAQQFMEVPKQGGSNGIAVGSELSANGRGLLLANPHMHWHREFQRFYPLHQTVPGVMDIVGATMIGRARTGFGVTEQLAWTSTVSTAKRHTFYQLQLVPGKPTHYLFDGKEYPMQEETVTVTFPGENGDIQQRQHTFYSTHYGAMLVSSPFFKWTEQSAYAIKLIDPGWRGEVSTFDQYDASTVAELKEVHNQNQFLTVNLIAADRNGDVLYTDPGPAPNLTSQQMTDCAVVNGAALDGSRSACMWGNDDDAAVPGIFGPANMPSLFRRDYVLNSNDSYWIPNADVRLEGFSSVLGTEQTARTLRTRSALKMVQRLVDRNARGEGGVQIEDLQTLVFANENQAGQQIRDDLVSLCRQQPEVTLDSGEKVDLSGACEALAAWDLHNNVESRGAMLLHETLAAANNHEYTRWLPSSFKPAVVFDLQRPLDTPNGLSANDNQVVLDSLAKAVLRLKAAGIALDAALGEVQYVLRNGARIPIHGGSEIVGVFNKIESDFKESEGYPEVTGSSTSWVLAADFADDGPRVRALLAYSLSANPDSPYYADQTQRFSDKQWLDVPFREQDIEAATTRRYSVSSGSSL